MSDDARPRVACVVVTRDRRALLGKCLSALLAQTHPVERIIVVDNQSSDGTPELVRQEFPTLELIPLQENVGGAGGFATGIAIACDGEADWVWLLDDDTIARPDALEQLLACPWREAGLPEPALLASRVDWTDGNPHPMNTPMMRRRDPDGLAAAAAAGLLALRAATFNSVLVARPALERHGGPVAGFFFQADDIEFTARLLRTGHGYLVPESVVEHRTPTPHTFMGDPVRFYHHLRNTLFMIRGEAWDPSEKASLCWVVVDSAARFLAANRFSRASVTAVMRAIAAGLGPVPTR